jgi:hypothetical protein
MGKYPGIYKRGKIYWITYTWHSRQYYESSHSHDIHDAETLLRRRKTELDAGRKPMRVSKTPTVDELLDLYIAQIEHPATQKRYRLSQRALSSHCGTCRITDVDAFMFDRFKELRIKQGVSPAGVNRDLALPRAAFNFAVERKMLAHSPLDGVKLFNEAKHRKPVRTISFSEERRILMCRGCKPLSRRFSKLECVLGSRLLDSSGQILILKNRQSQLSNPKRPQVYALCQ